jgi:hypothetical protein
MTVESSPPAGRRFFHENGLALAMFALFVLSFVGHVLAGSASSNDERREHGQPPLSLVAYVTSGELVESVFENWESEFLQMGAFVWMTVFLRQRGSPESKKCDGSEDTDEDPALHRHDPKAPWPVRRGGLALALYKHSLTIALLSLFALSFLLHAAGGAAAVNDEARLHGQPLVTTWSYLGTPRFWFESLQNWQSEFLSMFTLIVLTIFLREHGSSQSKPVAAPHEQTGE